MTKVRKPKLFLSAAVAAAVMLAGTLAAAQFGFSAHAQAATPAHPAGQRQCSLATLHGMYVANQSGFQVSVSPAGPFATAAIYVFDGRGHGHGITSKSINGNIVSHLRFTDHYTLTPDCAGTETVTDTTGAVRHYDFYTLPSGDRFTFLRTDPGVVATGIAEATGR